LTRYLYAPQMLTVFSSFDPPRLAIAREPGGPFQVRVAGVAGQRFVLQSSPDFASWQSLATNWLATNGWSYLDSQAGGRDGTFYRAIAP